MVPLLPGRGSYQAGHGLRLDAQGRLVGLTIVNAWWLLDQERPLMATMPQRVEIDATALGGGVLGFAHARGALLDQMEQAPEGPLPPPR